ncbi:MAG TPA: hypothetical protein VKA70_15320 [Blastocatellia bacterium]|nr:hypothetical protein [Blastocatellia bacterium]
MSSSSVSGRVTLNVETGDELAEVFVIDGQYNIADRGVGQSLTFSLDPGIYKIKVVAGTKTHEDQVALRPDSPPTLKQYQPLVIASAAPLADTSKTHEFHMEAAREHSRKVHVDAGSGSWVFVCARGWTEKDRTDNAEFERPNPAKGLKLLDEAGKMIVDIEISSANDLGWEPWAACNVSLPPGNYRLQLEVPSLDQPLERIIVASPGWQTHIFLLQSYYGQDPREAEQRGGEMRADLLTASVLMSGDLPPGPHIDPPGFDYNERDLHLVEKARLALANQRKILTDELRDVLRYKFRNPMLGIFGAHLLLLEAKPDMELLGIVVDNLRKMVGLEHPDVEALALKLKQPSNYRFETPPMLQRSWSMICHATADRPYMVPENSLLDEAAQRWWGNSIWLTWLTPESNGGVVSDEEASELSDLDEAILLQIKASKRQQYRAKSVVKKPKAPRTRGSVPTRGEDEDRAFAADDLIFGPEGDPSVGDSAPVADDLLPDVKRMSADEETIKKLTLQLGIPRSAVEKSIKVLEGKIIDKKL